MSDDILQRTLTEARGFLNLGMPAAAWETIEGLPLTECRLHPDVIALRLLILAKLRKWEMGTHLLNSVTAAHDEQHRAAAGAYLLALAGDHWCAGRIEDARAAVRRLCALYPEGKHMVASSPQLAAMWP